MFCDDIRCSGAQVYLLGVALEHQVLLTLIQSAFL